MQYFNTTVHTYILYNNEEYRIYEKVIIKNQTCIIKHLLVQGYNLIISIFKCLTFQKT